MASSHPTQLCRLCLQASADVVNIWETFQNSTIATILATHFWFQVNKNDGLTEWLCRTCWLQTETFHKFYERVEQLQKGYWDSVKNDDGGDNKTVPVDVKDAKLEVDLLTIVKEETELTFEVMDSQWIEEAELECNDESKSESQSSNNENQKTSESDDKLKVSVQPKMTDSDTVSDRLINETIRNEQDDQIREWFTMKCDICPDDLAFGTLADMRRHYRKVHKTRGYLTCCNRKFYRRHLIIGHIQSHTNPDLHRCQQCAKSFTTKHSLQTHIAQHVSLDKRAFKCNLCPSSFARVGILNSHIRNIHTSRKGGEVACEQCNKNYPSEFLLKYHMRNAHGNSLSYFCELCARQYKSKHSLQSHVISEHSTRAQPKFQCDICGRWLKTKNNILKHIREQHIDVRPANCPICKKVLRNKYRVSSHIRTTHGERNHRCTVCDKMFRIAKNLKEHIAAIHTGEHLYQCQYCEKKFNSNGNLFSHRKNTHFAEWTRLNHEQRISTH